MFTRKPYIQITLLFLITIVIYTITSPRTTAFNHFVLMAQSLLDGRLDITPYWQPHLERAVFGDKLYLPYPPMPAILLLPYVLFAGLQANQVYASIFFGSLNVVLVYLLLNKLTTKNRQLTTAKKIVITIFFAFATNNWFLSSFGSTWYFSHIVAVFFLLLAMNLIFTPLHTKYYIRSTTLAGMASGAAFMTRSPTLFAVPFFLIMLLDRHSEFRQSRTKNLTLGQDTWRRSSVISFLRMTIPKSVVLFLTGFGLLTTVNILYNALAFNTLFFNAGYTHLPGLLSEPWFNKGLFHPTYIIRHLEVLFALLPQQINTFPYFTPSKAGLAIWITTPLLFFALLAPLREKLVQASWVATILIAVPILTHGHTGIEQFGYRRMTDFMPFLLILMTFGIRKLRWYHYSLIMWGIGINLWGILTFQ